MIFFLLYFISSRHNYIISFLLYVPLKVLLFSFLSSVYYSHKKLFIMYQLKKKGKRRRREREPRNAAKILTLIKAVNDHKGFKQMASYNLSCLCKLVSPPLPDWNENLKFALKHGGLKACTAAVRANSGDESLLLAATSVMDQAATSEEGAAAVVSSGSLDACLDSIQANAGNMDSGALSATLTMSKIASKSSKNFVKIAILKI